jgi:hypothetical protein
MESGQNRKADGIRHTQMKKICICIKRADRRRAEAKTGSNSVVLIEFFSTRLAKNLLLWIAPLKWLGVSHVH